MKRKYGLQTLRLPKLFFAINPGWLEDNELGLDLEDFAENSLNVIEFLRKFK